MYKLENMTKKLLLYNPTLILYKVLNILYEVTIVPTNILPLGESISVKVKPYPQ